MFFTVGIVTTLAIAGYFGYKNKDQVFWNGVKIYDTIKDYCYQLRDNFSLKQIIIFNGEHYYNINTDIWGSVPFYLRGYCNPDDPNYQESVIAITYRLNNNLYCKLYPLYPTDCSTIMVDDITKMMEINKFKKQPTDHIEVNVNFILSGTYFDGFKDIDITELLQMFDTDGTFYIEHNKMSFNDIIKWCKELKLTDLNICNDENVDTNSQNKPYIEIINLYGDIKKFEPTDVLILEDELYN